MSEEEHEYAEELDGDEGCIEMAEVLEAVRRQAED